MNKVKWIVRAIWKDSGKPLKRYGRVVRGELVDKNDKVKFTIITKHGAYCYKKDEAVDYETIKKVVE